MADETPVAAKIKYKGWKEGDAWPKEIPRRVRNKLTGEIIFHNQRRIRPGVAFLLNAPQEYSLLSMEPADLAAERDRDAREVSEQGQPSSGRKVKVKAGQSSAVVKSSADVKSSYKRPADEGEAGGFDSGAGEFTPGKADDVL